MYFYDDKHEANFAKMVERFPLSKNDNEYKVACYVFAHSEIFEKATRKNWNDIFDDWMEQEDFSTSIRLLIDLALHLFGGGSHAFKLADGIAAWDTANFQVFQTACEIRKGWS